MATINVVTSDDPGLSRVALDAERARSLNVLDYGAVGDGATLNDAALASAFDAAVATNKTIYFPAGEYRIIGTLDWRGNDVHVQGEGQASVIRQMTDNIPIMRMGGVAISIDKMYLRHTATQPQTNTDAHALLLSSTSSSTFTNLWFFRSYSAIYQDSTPWPDTVSSVFSCIFNNIRSAGMSGYHYYLNGTNTGSSFDNIYMTGWLDGPGTEVDGKSAMYINSVKECVFNQINVEHGKWQYCIFLTTMYGCVFDSVHFEGVKSLAGPGAFWRVSRCNLLVNGVHVYSCDMETDYNWLFVDVTSNVTFDGVEIENTTVTSGIHRRFSSSSGASGSKIRFRNFSSDIAFAPDYTHPSAAGGAPLIVEDDDRRLIQPVLAGKTNVASDSATGFAYLPMLAGTPTGTPVTEAGALPVAATEDGSLWAWSSGSSKWVVHSGADASFEPETNELLDRMTVRPDYDHRAAINTLIFDLKADGIWNKLDSLHLLAAHTEQAALLNWKGTARNLIAYNSPTFTVDAGIAGDGATSYLATEGFDGAELKMAQNDEMFGVWMRDNVAEDKYPLLITNGATGGGSPYHYVNPRASSNAIAWRCDFDAVQVSGVHNGFNNRLYVCTRDVTSAYEYRSGAEDDTYVSPSVHDLRSVNPLYVVVFRNSNIFSKKQMGAMLYGKHLSAYENASLNIAIGNYMTALGAKL